MFEEANCCLQACIHASSHLFLLSSSTCCLVLYLLKSGECWTGVRRAWFSAPSSGPLTPALNLISVALKTSFTSDFVFSLLQCDVSSSHPPLPHIFPPSPAHLPACLVLPPPHSASPGSRCPSHSLHPFLLFPCFSSLFLPYFPRTSLPSIHVSSLSHTGAFMVHQMLMAVSSMRGGEKR